MPRLATRPTGQPSRPVDNPGGSIKPCQVFIGASIEHELTFRLDYFVGADHLGVPLDANITGAWQVGEHLRQGHVGLARQPSGRLVQSLFSLARSPAAA